MGYVNKVQVGSDAHLIEPTLFATATKNGTAYSASLDNFILVSGVAVNIKFTATNDAEATLDVNSTGAKDIFYNNAKIAASQLKANHTYSLSYDGTQWQLVGDIDTDTNTNTMQRTFRSSTDVELPIAGINATSSATATYNTSSSIGSGSYAGMYAAIPNTVANLATINPSTGAITVPGGITANLAGNAATATKIAAKLAATTKHFLVGTSTTLTGTAANVELLGDGGIYATTTSGELSAVKYSINASGTEKVRLEYNSTDQSLDFIFI